MAGQVNRISLERLIDSAPKGHRGELLEALKHCRTQKAMDELYARVKRICGTKSYQTKMPGIRDTA